MLFQSQAPQVVQSSLIQAKFNAEQERMEEAANRLCLYSDDYEDIIRETMSTLFHKSNYDRLYYHVNQSQNMLKRVVNELSMVYKAEARRTLSIENQRFEDIKSELDIDTRMKRVNRLTNLLNETIVRVGVRRGAIAWDIITPDIATVIQDENDPTRMAAVCWLRSSVNTMGIATVEYEYMDDLGYWGLLDQSFKPKEWFFDPATTPYRGPDGMPVMPLVVFHRQHPEATFWDQDSGRDLYNAAVLMGVKMTMLDYYFKASSFKQIYVIGSNVNVPDRQVLDPLTVFKVQLDPNTSGEIGTLDLQNRITELVQSLVFQLNSVINNYGISADMWTMSISEMSGRALKIKNRALLEQREEQLPTYRKGEGELFNVTRVVNNAHAGAYGWQKIPDAAEFEVDFAEIEFPEDPTYEIDLETKRLKSGLISLGKFYQRFNPDIKDEQEAEKALLDNLNKLKATREANPTLDEALNYILAGAQKQGQDQAGEAGAEGAGGAE